MIAQMGEAKGSGGLLWMVIYFEAVPGCLYSRRHYHRALAAVGTSPVVLGEAKTSITVAIALFHLLTARM